MGRRLRHIPLDLSAATRVQDGWWAVTSRADTIISVHSRHMLVIICFPLVWHMNLWQGCFMKVHTCCRSEMEHSVPNRATINKTLRGFLNNSRSRNPAIHVPATVQVWKALTRETTSNPAKAGKMFVVPPQASTYFFQEIIKIKTKKSVCSRNWSHPPHRAVENFSFWN